MEGRYRAKHFRNAEHTGFRRLLSVILCLCLLASVLQIQMITAFAVTNIDSVTVTHEGKKTEKLILPQNERATLKAECSPMQLPNTLPCKAAILRRVKLLPAHLGAIRNMWIFQ